LSKAIDRVCPRSRSGTTRRPSALSWSNQAGAMSPAVTVIRIRSYRVGTDQLVVGPDGSSRISLADFAIALIDEAEHKQHPRARFTVGY
jgi:putative NADH-flavin reductase